MKLSTDKLTFQFEYLCQNFTEQFRVITESLQLYMMYNHRIQCACILLLRDPNHLVVLEVPEIKL